jgi:hypothetical protein
MYVRDGFLYLIVTRHILTVFTKRFFSSLFQFLYRVGNGFLKKQKNDRWVAGSDEIGISQ